MKVKDLWQGDQWMDSILGSPPEMDPLREDDALQEAQVVDVSLDAVRGRIGILFDLRMALQLRDFSAGVLIARGLRGFHWTAPDRDTPLTAWTAEGSLVSREQEVLHMKFGMFPTPDAYLEVSAKSAFFVCGTIPGMSPTPPDYHEPLSPDELVTWDSPFAPRAISILS